MAFSEFSLTTFLPQFTSDKTSCRPVKKKIFVFQIMMRLTDAIFIVNEYFELYQSEINEILKMFEGL